MKSLLFLTTLLFCASPVLGGGAKVYGSGENTVSINAGPIGTDVEMEGFAIINGEVFVDGEKVPRGKKTVVSKKSGKTYRIDWGKNGNVSVTEQ